MDDPFTTKRLLALRKLTRAIAELVRGQLKDYLSTLTPLLRPRHVLGEYVQRGVKQATGGSASGASTCRCRARVRSIPIEANSSSMLRRLLAQRTASVTRRSRRAGR